MRKIIIVFFILLAVISIAYAFIPDVQKINSNIYVKSNYTNVTRSLHEKNMWEQWWNKYQIDDLIYEESNFAMQNSFLNIAEVNIKKDNSSENSIISVLQLNRDSSIVEWKYSLPASEANNNKIKKYFRSKEIKKQFEQKLQDLKSFVESPLNIYGLDIKQEKVKDSSFISIRTKLTAYPTTDVIYNLVDQLNNYIKESGAKATGDPMLHVFEMKDEYEIMVALPVNKNLPAKGNIQPKRMVLGNILVAEVRGGDETVRKGFREFENYVNDYGKTSPAIPFASLVTDRRKEVDTSKWLTKLYYPVF
jgi:effector-binding domain-containing protein